MPTPIEIIIRAKDEAAAAFTSASNYIKKLNKEVETTGTALGTSRREWMRTGTEASYYLTMITGKSGEMGQSIAQATGLVTQLGESFVWGDTLGTRVAVWGTAFSVLAGSIAYVTQRMDEAKKAAEEALKPYQEFVKTLEDLNKLSSPLAQSIYERLGLSKEEATVLADLVTKLGDVRTQTEARANADVNMVRVGNELKALQDDINRANAEGSKVTDEQIAKQKQLIAQLTLMSKAREGDIVALKELAEANNNVYNVERGAQTINRWEQQNDRLQKYDAGVQGLAKDYNAAGDATYKWQQALDAANDPLNVQAKGWAQMRDQANGYSASLDAIAQKQANTPAYNLPGLDRTIDRSTQAIDREDLSVYQLADAFNTAQAAAFAWQKTLDAAGDPLNMQAKGWALMRDQASAYADALDEVARSEANRPKYNLPEGPERTLDRSTQAIEREDKSVYQLAEAFNAAQDAQFAWLKTLEEANDPMFIQAQGWALMRQKSAEYYDQLEQIKDAQKSVAASVAKQFRDVVSQALTPTEVTPADMEATAKGTYVDKWDETRRRWESIAKGEGGQFKAEAGMLEELGMSAEQAAKRFKDFSLFADPKNLKFIDYGALSADVGNQLDQLVGQFNAVSFASEEVWKDLPKEKKDALMKMGIQSADDATRKLLGLDQDMKVDAMQAPGFTKHLDEAAKEIRERLSTGVWIDAKPGGGGGGGGGEGGGGEGGGGGGKTGEGFVMYDRRGPVTRTGLAYVHAGEYVLPRGAATRDYDVGFGSVFPNQTINLVVDGRVLARATVRHIRANRP